MADFNDAGREAEAKSLLAQAEERLKGTFLERMGLGDAKAKFQDASEMFNKAANNYKLIKKPDLAAQAYSKAAECFLKSDSKHDAATAYSNAAGVLKKVNNVESVKYLRKSADIYLDEGRFSIAAQRYKEMGESSESETELAQACDFFLRAADLFESENSQSNANTMKLKVATLYGTLEKYDQAAELFEKCAAANVDNKLISYSVPDYFFKAALCRLAMNDLVGAKKALERYGTQFYGWNGSREQKFTTELVGACENYDQEEFTSAVQNFDSIIRLDPWKTKILLAIKGTIQEPENSLT